MNNFIKKELIGRTYWNGGTLFIILGVRKNPRYEYWKKQSGIYYADFNYYECLIGKVWNRSEIEVYSWSSYKNQKERNYECRGSRRTISKCMKLRPELIHYHTGKRIDLTGTNVRIIERNTKYYKEYLQTL
jgi:hypothetical protein